MKQFGADEPTIIRPQPSVRKRFAREGRAPPRYPARFSKVEQKQGSSGSRVSEPTQTAVFASFTEIPTCQKFHSTIHR